MTLVTAIAEQAPGSVVFSVLDNDVHKQPVGWQMNHTVNDVNSAPLTKSNTALSFTERPDGSWIATASFSYNVPVGSLAFAQVVDDRGRPVSGGSFSYTTE